MGASIFHGQRWECEPADGGGTRRERGYSAFPVLRSGNIHQTIEHEPGF